MMVFRSCWDLYVSNRWNWEWWQKIKNTTM